MTRRESLLTRQINSRHAFYTSELFTHVLSRGDAESLAAVVRARFLGLGVGWVGGGGRWEVGVGGRGVGGRWEVRRWRWGKPTIRKCRNNHNTIPHNGSEVLVSTEPPEDKPEEACTHVLLSTTCTFCMSGTPGYVENHVAAAIFVVVDSRRFKPCCLAAARIVRSLQKLSIFQSCSDSSTTTDRNSQ